MEIISSGVSSLKVVVTVTVVVGMRGWPSRLVVSKHGLSKDPKTRLVGKFESRPQILGTTKDEQIQPSLEWQTNGLQYQQPKQIRLVLGRPIFFVGTDIPDNHGKEIIGKKDADVPSGLRGDRL